MSKLDAKAEESPGMGAEKASSGDEELYLYWKPSRETKKSYILKQAPFAGKRKGQSQNDVVNVLELRLRGQE
jgi:hypothetical protein